MTTSDAPKLRDSAAVVLVRGHGRDLEVFWVRRSDAVTFMPGFQAFIGGSADPDDRELPIEGVADAHDRMLRACALREAFEEAGVLGGLVAPVPLAPLAEARRRLLAGDATFSALAREHGWRFRGDALVSAGRWQTPPFAVARFDTVYFLLRMPEGQQASVHPGELASGEWIRPAEALERYRRGDATFAAPILYTMRELDAGEENLAERMSRLPQLTGQPVRRIELKWGVVLQPMKTRPLPPATHTNAYLVGEREMALIDPGSGEPAELDALFKLIETLEGDGRKLELILATHHHSDHIAGIEAVRAKYHVPVAAHREIAGAIDADRTLGDGDVVPLAGGWDLRAIHTPGHTRTHLCFLHERTHSLFCGDHIVGGTGTVIIDPPEGDMAAYVRSLERLLTMNIETLFPGHGGPRGGAERRIRWLIAHRLEREAKVLAALDREPRTIASLVERAYHDTPRDLWPYAERSLLAHLLKLEGEGRASRDGDRWRRGSD